MDAKVTKRDKLNSKETNQIQRRQIRFKGDKLDSKKTNQIQRRQIRFKGDKLDSLQTFNNFN